MQVDTPTFTQNYNIVRWNKNINQNKNANFKHLNNPVKNF